MAPDNVAPQTVEIENWFHEDIQLTIMGKRENVVPIEELYKEGFRQIRIYLTAGKEFLSSGPAVV
jgi:hypothetical protein